VSAQCELVAGADGGSWVVVRVHFFWEGSRERDRLDANRVHRMKLPHCAYRTVQTIHHMGNPMKELYCDWHFLALWMPSYSDHPVPLADKEGNHSATSLNIEFFCPVNIIANHETGRTGNPARATDHMKLHVLFV
jgi:hypothetical protein